MVFRIKISQKNQTHFCMGIQGYRDTRPSVGGTGQKSETRETKHLKNHGDTRDTKDTRALPEKPNTFLIGNTRIQGYQTLCRGYRTKIRDWGDQAA